MSHAPSSAAPHDDEVALLYPSMRARDMAAVRPLPAVDTLWHALKAIERAAMPDAAQEERDVATFLDRQQRGLPVGTNVTLFHSAVVPELSFTDYATLVAERTGYGREGVAVGIALMGRYAVATKRGVTPLSMHRLFATAMQLGMKATSDGFVKNKHVASIAGMRASELNHLECLLYAGADYHAVPTLAELTELPRALAGLGGRSAPGSSSSDLFAVLSQYCDVRAHHHASAAASADSSSSSSGAGDDAPFSAAHAVLTEDNASSPALARWLTRGARRGCRSPVHRTFLNPSSPRPPLSQSQRQRSAAAGASTVLDLVPDFLDDAENRCASDSTSIMAGVPSDSACWPSSTDAFQGGAGSTGTNDGTVDPATKF